MTFIRTYNGKIESNRRGSHLALDDPTDVYNDSYQIVLILCVCVFIYF